MNRKVNQTLFALAACIATTSAAVATCGWSTKITSLDDSHCLTSAYWTKTCDNWNQSCENSGATPCRGCKAGSLIPGTCTYKYYQYVGCFVQTSSTTFTQNFTTTTSTVCYKNASGQIVENP